MTDSNKSNMLPFLSHLESLRWHLVRSIISIFIASILAFINKSFIFDNIIFACKENDFPTYIFLCHLSEKLCMQDMPFILMNVEMAGQFTMHIMVSFVVGLILAFPYLVFEIWRFISPGLHSHERLYSILLFFFSIILFAIGILFGYFIIIPFSINFLSTYIISDTIENNIHFISFIRTISTIVLTSGVLFQLPIVVYFLTKFNFVNSNQLKQYRRHSFVIILLLASVLTPPDIFSQILIAIPIVILYEFSIFISYLTSSKT